MELTWDAKQKEEEQLIEHNIPLTPTSPIHATARVSTTAQLAAPAPPVVRRALSAPEATSGVSASQKRSLTVGRYLWMRVRRHFLSVHNRQGQHRTGMALRRARTHSRADKLAQFLYGRLSTLRKLQRKVTAFSRSDTMDMLKRSVSLQKKDTIYKAAMLIQDGYHARSPQHIFDRRELQVWQVIQGPTWRRTLWVFAVIHLLLAVFEPPALSRHQSMLPFPVTHVVELCVLAIYVTHISLVRFCTGPKHFSSHYYRYASVVLVLAMLADNITSLARGEGSARYTKAARPFFILVFSRYARQMLRLILYSFRQTLKIFALVVAHVGLFSMFGFYLFSDQQNNTYFSTAGRALNSMFVLLTTANFPDVMVPAFEQSRWYVFFFLAFIVSGIYIFISLVLATLYNAFAEYHKRLVLERVQQVHVILHRAFCMVADDVGPEAGVPEPDMVIEQEEDASILRRKKEAKAQGSIPLATWRELARCIRPDMRDSEALLLWFVMDEEGKGVVEEEDFIDLCRFLLPHKMGVIEDNLSRLSRLRKAQQDRCEHWLLWLCPDAMAMLWPRFRLTLRQLLEVRLTKPRTNTVNWSGLYEAFQDLFAVFSCSLCCCWSFGCCRSGASSASVAPSPVNISVEKKDAEAEQVATGRTDETHKSPAPPGATAVVVVNADVDADAATRNHVTKDVAALEHSSSHQSKPAVAAATVASDDREEKHGKEAQKGGEEDEDEEELDVESGENLRALGVGGDELSNHVRWKLQAVGSDAETAWTFSGAFFDLLVVANTITLCVQAIEGRQKDNSGAYVDANYVFIVAFCVELLLKLIAHGLWTYWEDRTRAFDGVIIILSLLGELVFTATPSVASVPRVLRLFRLVRLFDNFDDILHVLTTVIGPRSISLVLCLFALQYCFACIGMELWSGTLTPQTVPSTMAYATGQYWSLGFDDLTSAMTTMQALLLVNNWFVFMEAVSHVHGESTRVFFVLFNFLGVWLCMNVVISFLIDSFIWYKNNEVRLANDDDNRKLHAGLSRYRRSRSAGALAGGLGLVGQRLSHTDSKDMIGFRDAPMEMEILVGMHREEIENKYGQRTAQQMAAMDLS